MATYIGANGAKYPTAEQAESSKAKAALKGPEAAELREAAYASAVKYGIPTGQGNETVPVDMTVSWQKENEQASEGNVVSTPGGPVSYGIGYGPDSKPSAVPKARLLNQPPPSPFSFVPIAGEGAKATVSDVRNAVSLASSISPSMAVSSVLKSSAQEGDYYKVSGNQPDALESEWLKMPPAEKSRWIAAAAVPNPFLIPLLGIVGDRKRQEKLGYESFRTLKEAKAAGGFEPAKADIIGLAQGLPGMTLGAYATGMAFQAAPKLIPAGAKFLTSELGFGETLSSAAARGAGIGIKASELIAGGLFTANVGSEFMSAAKEKDVPKFLSLAAGTAAQVGFFGMGYARGDTWAGKTIGILKDESIFQPRISTSEAYAVGKLSMETGRTALIGDVKSDMMLDVYQQQARIKGVLGNVGKTETGFQMVTGAKAGESKFGVSYDLVVGKDESGKVNILSIWDLFQGRSYVERPSGRVYGGRGVLPSTEIGLERISGMTFATSKSVGQPEVIGEWAENGVDMLTLRTKKATAGLSVTSEQISPFAQKSTLDISSRAIVSGGGGKSLSNTGNVPFELMGGLDVGDTGGSDIGKLSMPEWAKSSGALTSVGGYATESQMGDLVVTTSLQGSQQSQRTQTRTRQKQSNTNLGQSLTGIQGSTQTGTQAQSRLMQGLQTRQMTQQLLNIQTTTLAPPITATPALRSPNMGIPLIPSFPIQGSGKKKTRRFGLFGLGRLMTRYTPTIAGIVSGKTIRRAPRIVGVETAGIRYPVSGKRTRSRNPFRLSFKW